MPLLHFDKEKYLQIMSQQSAAAALTQLQSDIVKWEYESFEGTKGYQPEMWKEIDEARELARTIWDLSQETSKP